MKLQRFNGGLATRLAPQFIRPEQSTVNVNIDNSVGTLLPVKDKTLTAETVQKYFSYYNRGDEFISSTFPSDYLEFQGFIYTTDRLTNLVRKRVGTEFTRVGVVRPETAPALENVEILSNLNSISFVNADEATVVGPAPGTTVTGDLPSVVLNYMVFIEKEGAYSTGYSMSVEPTVNGTTSRYNGRYTEQEEDAFLPDFEISSVSDKSRLIQISNFNLQQDESVVVFRYHKDKWRRVGSTPNNGDVIIDSLYNLVGTELDKSLIANFNGTYQYVYTYYNVNDGSESAPSDISLELKASSGFIRLTLPDTSLDPQVTHKRIYRVGNNLALFTLVDEVAANVTTYDDTLSDINVDGRTLQSENYFEAPTGLKYITESYAMLFGALGNQLRFTPIGVPTAWPPEFSLQFDDDITGIGAVANGILVMTLKRTHLVTGTGPSSLSSQTLRGDQGCISHDSIQQVEGGAIVWASQDGLCVSSGNNPKNITKYQLGDIKFNPTSSAVHNEVYYLHNNDGIIFIWDYRFEPVFKQLDLGVEYIQEANGAMYGWSQGQLFTLLDSDENLSFTYSSPLFVEGSFTERKTYNKFFVYSVGQIEFKVYIDNVLVMTKNFTGEGLQEFKIPQDFQVGYYLHFEASGTGEVKEVEYVVGRRKNG